MLNTDHIVRLLSKRLSLEFLLRRSKRPFIPYYHAVAESAPDHVKHLYPVISPEEFEKDMDYLLANFTPIALSDLIAHVRDEVPLPEKALHLTFDDGLRECYEVVAPILEAKGIPATFFLTTDLIDNEKLFYRHLGSVIKERSIGKRGFVQRGRVAPLLDYDEQQYLHTIAEAMKVDGEDYLQSAKPYMTTEMVRDLLARGFTIGAHSLDHPAYFLLSLEEQIRQTKASVSLIKDRFNIDYAAFAFPFTDRCVSKEFFDSIAADIDIAFGSANLKRDIYPWILHRSNIEDSSEPVDMRVKTCYVRYLLRKFTGSWKVRRK
ncbi:MAG: hypothetical protein CL946_12090 [Ectothiorhodospiraceae bacterium]|nr:hypothetical protein [Ectothiorhodospiraceae bacterium]